MSSPFNHGKGDLVYIPSRVTLYEFTPPLSSYHNTKNPEFGVYIRSWPEKGKDKDIDWGVPADSYALVYCKSRFYIVKRQHVFRT